jgi:hypothetical protein
MFHFRIYLSLEDLWDIHVMEEFVKIKELNLRGPKFN